MKTPEEMQAAVDDIRAVCKQHGVVLIGSCYSEGIHGEIELIDAAEVSKADLERLTNTAEFLCAQMQGVLGIGDPKSQPA